jgi:hypothetical protein
MKNDNKVAVFKSLILAALIAAPTGVIAHTFDVTGSMTTSDGMAVAGAWGDGGVSLRWRVNHTDETIGGVEVYKTYYTYHLTHPETATYSFVLELHPFMLNDPDFAIVEVNSTLPNYEMGTFEIINPAFGDTGTITGIRFWGEGGGTEETIAFASGYLPMWGDFFAEDKAHTSTLWNKGFTAVDSDPDMSNPDNGLQNPHVLVPGFNGMAVIPIPGTIWLFASGILFLFGWRTNKKGSSLDDTVCPITPP